jgi:hypothetical protein
MSAARPQLPHQNRRSSARAKPEIAMSAPELMLNAEIAAWNRLEAKVKEAIELAKRARYDTPYRKLNEALASVKDCRDYVKEMHQLDKQK